MNVPFKPQCTPGIADKQRSEQDSDKKHSITQHTDVPHAASTVLRCGKGMVLSFVRVSTNVSNGFQPCELWQSERQGCNNLDIKDANFEMRAVLRAAGLQSQRKGWHPEHAGVLAWRGYSADDGYEMVCDDHVMQSASPRAGY